MHSAALPHVRLLSNPAAHHPLTCLCSLAQAVAGDKGSWAPVMKARKVAAAGAGGGNATSEEVLEPVPFIDNGWVREWQPSPAGRLCR